MSITPETVSAALEPLRQGFQADGADLAVDEATDELVKVRLVTDADTCLDCIMPTPFLITVLETAVRDSFPALGRFELVDTRE